MTCAQTDTQADGQANDEDSQERTKNEPEFPSFYSQNRRFNRALFRRTRAQGAYLRRGPLRLWRVDWGVGIRRRLRILRIFVVGRCCGASVLCVVLVLLLCLIEWLSVYCRSIYNVRRLRFRYHLEPGLLMYLETRLFIGVVVSHVAYCDHCVLCSFNVYALFCLMCSSISRLCYHQVFMICRSAGVVAICVKRKEDSKDSM